MRKEIWVVDYDGANEIRITNSRDLNLNPSWSHDGSAIAYAALRGGSFYDILLSFITTGVLQNVTKGWNAQNGGCVSAGHLPGWEADRLQRDAGEGQRDRPLYREYRRLEPAPAHDASGQRHNADVVARREADCVYFRPHRASRRSTS